MGDQPRVVLLPFSEELESPPRLVQDLAALGYLVDAWVADSFDQAAAETLGCFDRVLNLTAGFRRGPTDALDVNLMARLKEFEEEWGEPFLHSDSVIDRGVSGFSVNLTDSASLFVRDRWHWTDVCRLADLLRSNVLDALATGPVAVIGETNKFWNRIVARVVRLQRLPFLYVMELPYADGRFHVMTDFSGQWPECAALFNEFLQLGIPVDLRSAALRIYRGIVEHGEKPHYFERDLSSYENRVRKGARNVYRAARLVARSRQVEWRSSTVRPYAELVTPHAVLKRYIDSWRRKRYFDSKLVTTLPKTDYIAVFLHAQPEWTVESISFDYQDQVSLVRNVCAALPVGVSVVVKEHPYDAGRRSSEFYAKLCAIGDAQLVGNSVDSVVLASGSLGVISLSGTITLEAVCLGVPALVFGDTYYGELAGVTRVLGWAHLRDLLRNPFTLTAAVEIEALVALAARLGASVAGAPDDSAAMRSVMACELVELFGGPS